jgi:hypothetical protein
MLSSKEIEIIRKSANTIQVSLNLQVNKVSGLKAGLVADKLGMKWDAQKVIIEDIH